VRPIAARSNIQLHDKSEVCSGHVLADRQRLKQVLLNLLTNAVKYNRPHGNVTLSCATEPDGRLRILVRDEGQGIAADKIERLFLPFERLGAERSAIEGTGLGLVLSQRLMQAMDSTIQVESTQGKGSTFSFVLPMVAGPLETIPLSINWKTLHLTKTWASTERCFTSKTTIPICAWLSAW
jgi:signal transduction histidine kinase